MSESRRYSAVSIVEFLGVKGEVTKKNCRGNGTLPKQRHCFDAEYWDLLPRC